ncbi:MULTISPECIES: hypothetical protein [Nostoc]|uniref:Uncharacterized protein n=1 Tax=Nostoc paludosum FACHB-159 TaxID=2692908 RepID=A0ABR8KID3_9NOSO|nr:MULTISPECIES: hypothetical protein [Nostoc]MBD2682985.1 hypothetical protein [Nostoc sp. FACHB-857]MBD2739325.1 hypothetical protein [Nostoc paludosum FACHB-159]
MIHNKNCRFTNFVHRYENTLTGVELRDDAPPLCEGESLGNTIQSQALKGTSFGDVRQTLCLTSDSI